jgi:hypothetical protein
VRKPLKCYNNEMEDISKTEYIHLPIGEEVRSITGNYVVIKEEIINISGREIIYAVGFASFDSSCCGTGGCSYAFVPGFIESLHEKTDANGCPISIVSPIKDDKIRKKITKILISLENVGQVNFL